MSEDCQRIEVITGVARRRQWSTEAKLRIIEESFEPGETVSSVARRNGVAPNLLYRWRRLLCEGDFKAQQPCPPEDDLRMGLFYQAPETWSGLPDA